jgi:hypothetical protein
MVPFISTSTLSAAEKNYALHGRSPTGDKAHDRHDERDYEDDLGDACGAGSQPEEPEHRSNKSD